MSLATTKNGRKLAKTLEPLIGSSNQIQHFCSKICRWAVTHHRLAEDECNIAFDDEGQKLFDERVEIIEQRITALVARLPETAEGPLTVEFQGDPRGATVKLLVNNMKRHPSYNGWALEAIIVPTEN